MAETEAPRSGVSVGDLLSSAAPEDLALRLLAGSAGLRRPVLSAEIDRPGIALARGPESLPQGSIQVLDRPETAFLAEGPPEARRALLDRLARSGVAAIILGQGADVHPDLVRACETHALPLLSTAHPSAAVVERLGRFLEERLAPSVTLHGTLVDIYGVGVLLLGPSGIGKSESALELVLRGHRLVTDDSVALRRIGGGINGTGPEVSRFHMELRGIGIINIKDLFGVAAVRERKDVDLVIQLDRWQEGKDYERLGLDERTFPILGVRVPFIELPVGPGRNLSILLEVAARNQLLRGGGYHAGRELAERIQQTLGRGA